MVKWVCKDVLYDNNFWENGIYQEYDVSNRFDKEDVEDFINQVKMICLSEYEEGVKNVGNLK